MATRAVLIMEILALTETRAMEIRSPRDWIRLVSGMAVVFVLFQVSAIALGSDRGQAGIVVGALVTAATLAAERLWFTATLVSATRAVGLRTPSLQGLIVAGGIAVLLFLVLPFYVAVTGSHWAMDAHWLERLPGLFAQAGIAEEVLFRGYLFGHLRRGRSFWRAATISMVPFFVVHLLMFLTMPWPIAMASLLLAVVISFPMAHLFELGNMTIWPPAFLHFIVQGTVKTIHIAGESSDAFPLVWIGASAVIPALSLFVRRPASG